jgi:hypothetical protein
MLVAAIAQVKDAIGGDATAETPIGTPFRDHKDIEVSRNWQYFIREQVPQWTNIAIGAVIGAIVTGIIGWIVRLFRSKKSKGSNDLPPNPEW